MTKHSKTELAAVQATEIVDPAMLEGFAAFAGEGHENLGKDDLAIPFLTILQSGSPQVKRSDGEFIEGAAEGMLFNTVTKEVIDPAKTPVLIVACHYERNFVEWKLRDNGGGFVKQHPVGAGMELLAKTYRDEKGRDILPNNNQLNDTRSFYVLVLDANGVPSPAFITMTSTQIKKSKQWLMQQKLLKLRRADGVMYTPPRYASKWRITTVPESNDKGSWMGWAFEHAGWLKGPQDPVFIEAREFKQQVEAGTVKADLARAVDDAGGVADGRTIDEDDVDF